MSYQPHPTSGLDQPPPSPQAPPSIRTAVKLMCAGAILSGLSLIINIIGDANPGTLLVQVIGPSGKPLPASQLHSPGVADIRMMHTFEVENMAEIIALTVILGLVVVNLWLWMAWENARGRGWARIVAAVLFGLSTVGVIYLCYPPAIDTTMIIGILGWLIGLGATVCLWWPGATQYYRRSKAFRLAS